ncbi:unnamed protein product [Gadus morhua 'NCC']
MFIMNGFAHRYPMVIPYTHTPPPELVRTGQMAAPGTTLCPSPCDSWVYISYHGPTRPLGKLHTKDGWTLDAG